MKDKPAFVVAIVAVAIALIPLRGELAAIDIEFGFWSCSLLALLYTTFGILVLSGYAYALDYVRYGFPVLDRVRIFGALRTAGDVLYTLGVLSPLVYATLWLVSIVIRALPRVGAAALQGASLVVAVAAFVGTFLEAIRAAARRRQEQYLAAEEQTDEAISESLLEARSLVGRRLWSLAVVEAYRSLEVALKSAAGAVGLESERVPVSRIVNLLAARGMLTDADRRTLRYVREVRNQAVHSDTDIGEEQAREVLDLIFHRLLPRIHLPRRQAASYEAYAVKALTDEGGPFPGATLTTRYDNPDLLSDAAVSSKKWIYFVDVLASSSRSAVRKAISRLVEQIPPDTRGIVIVPSTAAKVKSDNPRIVVLYLDPGEGKFLNLDDVDQW